MIEINIDIENINSVQNLLHAYPERVERSAIRAINKAAKTLRTDIFKKVKEDYNLPKSTVIRGYVYIKNASKGNIQSELQIKAKNFGAEHFAPKKTNGGISISVNKNQRYLIKGAFLMQCSAWSNKIVAKRQGKPRFPINKMWGPALHQMFNENDVNVIMDDVKTKYLKEFTRQMEGAANFDGARK